MSCDQYEDLLARAAGRCEICGQLRRYAPAGALYMDHEKPLGYWAVRGLLCSRCNHIVDRPEWADCAEVVTYLANPWYRCLPFAATIEPEDLQAGPKLDPALALELVIAAADRHRENQTNHGGNRNRAQRRSDSHLGLVDAVRTAARSGVRQTEIVKATCGLWSREQVYVVVAERRTQPRLPSVN